MTQISALNTFVDGTKINAAPVNQNFETLRVACNTMDVGISNMFGTVSLLSQDFVSVHGSTMQAALNMGNNIISNLTAGSNTGQAVEYTQMNTAISTAVSAIPVIFPRNTIDGLILSNSTVIVTNVSAGQCADSTNTVLITLPSASTVSITTAGLGGLDTGSEAPSTWYHVYMLQKADGTVGTLMSTNATTPTLPATYIYYRRIGSVYNNSSSNIKTFYQQGSNIIWSTPVMDYVTTIGQTTRKLFTISTPLGVSTLSSTSFTIGNGGVAAQSYTLLTSPYADDVAPTNILHDVIWYNSGSYYFENSIYKPLLTNTSSQIAIRTDNSSSFLRLLTSGYTDFRGKQ